MLPKRANGHLAWAALAFSAAAAAADGPQKLLERMNQALMGRSYEGVFVRRQGGHEETFRIIHRVQGRAISERLVSLDSGREFIRSGNQLSCYLPDQHKVLVEREPEASLLLGGLPTIDAAASSSYEITSLKSTRFLGRKTQVIAVNPKDDYRYGYRLWIDEKWAMPLKTQLCGAEGQVIEQVMFVSPLVVNPHIPDSAFRPETATDGFLWVRNDETAPAPSAAGFPALWSASRLPPGFHMSARAAHVMPGSDTPVAHLVFTDGIASVSVFVESHAQGGAQPPQAESVQVGSSSAFSAVIAGHQVTAVGEVPPQTVRFIVNYVRADAAPTAPSATGRVPTATPTVPVATPTSTPALSGTSLSLRH